MERDERIVEEMEDDFALFVARLQSRHCHNLAANYARSLQNKAMVAITAGCMESAIWYSEREFDFCCRAFGLSHPRAKESMKRLNALQQSAMSYRKTAVAELFGGREGQPIDDVNSGDCLHVAN